MNASIADQAVRSRPSAAFCLTILFLANVISVADRLLLGVVVDPIKSELVLSDLQMSIISGTAFAIFNLTVGVFVARWVDVGNRKWILTFGITIWTLATAGTGLAEGFYTLCLARMLVGIGEATAFPVAISLIGDLYAPDRRPFAISFFQSSNFVGLIGGSIIAGLLAAALGWRSMFILCGLGGLALVAVIILLLREPERTAHPEAEAEARPTLAASLRTMLAIRGFVPIAIGTAFALVIALTLPTWSPAYLMRSHGVPLQLVGAAIGPTVGIGGITGTLASGALASFLVRRTGREMDSLLVPIIAVPLSAPFYLVFTLAPSLEFALIGAGFMNFFLAMAIAPCTAAAISMVAPQQRALASMVLLATSGVIGGALAPMVVGALSDALAPVYGPHALRYAMAALMPTTLIAGAFLWLGYRQVRQASGTKAAA